MSFWYLVFGVSGFWLSSSVSFLHARNPKPFSLPALFWRIVFLVSLATTVHHQSKCYSLLFYLSILCAHTSTERACQNATRFSDLPKGPLRVRNTSGFQHFRFRNQSTRYTDDYCLSKCNMLFHPVEMSNESFDASCSLWTFSGYWKVCCILMGGFRQGDGGLGELMLMGSCSTPGVRTTGPGPCSQWQC